MIRFACLLLVGLILCGCAASSEEPSPQALRVGIAPTAAPFAFKQDGELVGAEVDLARELGKVLGRPVLFVAMPFDALIPALRGGKIDIIMAGMSITTDRSKVVSFARPYLQVGQMAAVRPELAQRYFSIRAVLLTDAPVGYERGTTAEQVVTRQFPKAKGKAYRSLDAAVDALARGEVDVVMGDGPSIEWMTRQRPGDMMIPDASYFTEEHLAWAFRPADASLRDEVNAALVQLQRNQTIEKIYGKWSR